MDPLWLLKGEHDAPGWKSLTQQAKDAKIDWRLFDRDAWVLLRAPQAPTEYEGMEPSVPPDGLYIDQQGNHLYLVDRTEVPNAEALIEALGDDAQALLTELGDPLTVLQRLGRAY